MGLVLETVMQYLIGATSSQSYVLFVTQRRMPILERLTITRQSSFKKRIISRLVEAKAENML